MFGCCLLGKREFLDHSLHVVGVRIKMELMVNSMGIADAFKAYRLDSLFVSFKVDNCFG